MKQNKEEALDEWGEKIILNEDVLSLNSKWCMTKNPDYSSEVYDEINFKQGKKYCKLNF